MHVREYGTLPHKLNYIAGRCLAYFNFSIILLSLSLDVPLSMFTNFNKLRQITTDMKLLPKALSTSKLLEVGLSYCPVEI